MRVLKVSRAGREIERLVLHRPHHLIGRSPHCDLVLRAKGVRAVHFVVEWIGEGAFDPAHGNWSVFEVGTSADAPALGKLLTDKALPLGDFEFSVEEARIEVAPKIGGRLLASMLRGDPASTKPDAFLDCLEVVQLYSGSGAVEEIRHFPPARLPAKSFAPLREFSDLRVRPVEGKGVQLELLGGSESPRVYRGGGESIPFSQATVGPTDTLRVEYRQRTFYFRFVERIEEVPIPRQIFEEKPSRTMVLSVLLPVLMLALTLIVATTREVEVNEEPPPRIVRLEAEVPPSAAIPEPPPPPPPVEAQAPPPDVGTQAPEAKAEDHAAGQASSIKLSKQKAEQVSLSQPAPQKNVTRLGVLGVLGKGPKGKGVRAENIGAQELMGETPTSAGGKVVVNTQSSGTLGTGTGGSPDGDSRELLAGASTKLQGSHNPQKGGPIVGSGSGRGGIVGSLGNGRSDVPGLSLGGSGVIRVEGGLDRETVRRIVRAQQGQIQVCYERALVKNAQLSGRFVLDWTISAPGPVSGVKLVSGNAKFPEFTSCLLDVIRATEFPKAKNGQPTRVIYPFEFKPAGVSGG